MRETHARLPQDTLTTIKLGQSLSHRGDKLDLLGDIMQRDPVRNALEQVLNDLAARVRLDKLMVLQKIHCCRNQVFTVPASAGLFALIPLKTRLKPVL
jgi:hypothetical protein